MSAMRDILIEIAKTLVHTRKGDLSAREESIANTLVAHGYLRWIKHPLNHNFDTLEPPM